VCHEFLVVTVKKLLKSVYIHRSYRQNKPGVRFFGTPGSIAARRHLRQDATSIVTVEMPEITFEIVFGT